ncbi:RsmB/NOP family class I SAM-dependent RNA methyltransferase [Georgenia sunbinii]|uniref:RsmB/NOP family class I SAM-dependent RNA methyltransferase n=1 Tax=Georgenia sunbinii TaxID=3117728 RepID=UPI002F261036
MNQEQRPDRSGAGGPSRGGAPRSSGGRGGSSAPRSGQPDAGVRRGGARRGGSDRGGAGIDPARLAAADTLQAVTESDAYANLVLPGLLRERGLVGRDAAFATELTYGTLRMRGRYDAIIERCTRGRSLAEVDPPLLDLLRLGCHQLLATRVPPHAAVSQTVDLVRTRLGQGAAGFANAVLRAVGRRDQDAWLAEITAGATDDVGRLAAAESHPTWIVRALRASLAAAGRPASELPELLAAHNAAPAVTLVARPGLVSAEDLAEDVEEATGQHPEPGRWAPTALRLPVGDPAALTAVREHRAGVQDEGSQLVALALAAAPLGADPSLPAGGAPTDSRWLDLCAGPGGKAALLGALAADRDAHLVANEVAPHRARLVRQSVSALPDGVVDVRTGDGRDLPEAEAGTFDRVLVDAPCTGLGALRRRPESRWRRVPADVPDLTALQRGLLDAALAAVRPGGVVGYVTCSPHVAETRAVVDDALKRHDVELLDARDALTAVAGQQVPALGDGPLVQLWPHVHGTDAMFLALLRRRS